MTVVETAPRPERVLVTAPPIAPRASRTRGNVAVEPSGVAITAAPAATPAAIAAPIAPVAERVDPLTRESELLARALHALGPDPAATLALVEGAGDAGRAPMSEDRQFLAIEALVALGRSAEAQARADAFCRRFPGSPHTGQIERLLRNVDLR